MSPAMVWILFPQSCASSSRRSARRAVAMTCAPAVCSTRANRAPSPAEAPVTSATRPSSRHRSLVPARGTDGSASFIVSPMNRPGASLRAYFVDEVERGLGGAPEASEPGVGGYLPDGGLAGLGAERVAAGLGGPERGADLGGRQAVHGRRRGRHPEPGGPGLLQRLHPGAIRLE